MTNDNTYHIIYEAQSAADKNHFNHYSIIMSTTEKPTLEFLLESGKIRKFFSDEIVDKFTIDKIDP